MIFIPEESYNADMGERIKCLRNENRFFVNFDPYWSSSQTLETLKRVIEWANKEISCEACLFQQICPLIKKRDELAVKIRTLKPPQG